jgi:Ala-tRNA(Pro) deacylase
MESAGVSYDTVPHQRTSTSRQSAISAHVPGSKMAKTVVVHHEVGYALAVVPSTHRVELGALQDILDKRLGLASEDETETLFADCDTGAIPPIGAAYDVPVILDESLGEADDVYFEGGDHKTLVHVSGRDFRNLTKGAQRARFSHPSL